MSGSFARRLVVGGLQYLADRDLIAWDDEGAGEPYTTDTEWPGYLGPTMPPSPDRLVVGTQGVVTMLRADVIVGMQIRIRGAASSTESEPDQRPVEDKAQQILDAFYPNGFPLRGALFGTIRVGAVLAPNLMPVPQDDRGRYGAIINVQVRARRPRPE